MGNTGEGHPTAHERLAEMKSLEEVLETAMSFEKTAEAFYADLAGRVRKPLRELVTGLAEEEARHHALFADVRDHADTQAHLRDLIEIPATDHKFSDFVQAPSLGEAPDDQEILQYALGREQAAYEQYAALAESAPTGPLKDLFRYLADEELRHKGELEKSYYEIVHSGGV